jgi:Spy/CpxP family protein refolding chaperone
MMRNVAIGLAAATIAIAGSTPSASALYDQQQSGISKSMSGPVQGEHGRRVAREVADLTPLQRERLKGIARERLAELTPRQRAHLRRITRQLADRERLREITGGRYAELTWLQRARLRRITRQLADLTPLQRERLRGIMRERYEQFSPVERERYRQGPYGRR